MEASGAEAVRLSGVLFRGLKASAPSVETCQRRVVLSHPGPLHEHRPVRGDHAQAFVPSVKERAGKVETGASNVWRMGMRRSILGRHGSSPFSSLLVVWRQWMPISWTGRVGGLVKVGVCALVLLRSCICHATEAPFPARIGNGLPVTNPVTS